MFKNWNQGDWEGVVEWSEKMAKSFNTDIQECSDYPDVMAALDAMDEITTPFRA